MRVTPIVTRRGRRLVEVYRRQGERRPVEVKGLRRLWTESVGLDGKRDMYEDAAQGK